MKHIIDAFSTLFVLMLNIVVCICVVNASGQAAVAKEYKADVIAEIENSNFNLNVINQCINQAAAAGYELQVVGSMYDEFNNIQMAEVILSYRYEMPLFRISETKVTRGFAR